MAKLGVNVDHIATIRQARGGTEPDPVTAAAMAELAGADGITVHLREDRRHIQDRDVMLLRRTVQTHLNLEMAATDEMVAIAMKVVPDYVTLEITEADAVVKGQTASSSYKPALLENGLKVMVPPFIGTGEKIIVDTNEVTYVRRASEG